MAIAQHSEILTVFSQNFFSVITDYQSYPNFVPGCQSITVDRKSPTQAEVTYGVQILGSEFTYTLAHQESPNAQMTWNLVNSSFFKKNQGKWEIHPLELGRCRVTYSVEMEWNLPAPQWMVKRFIQVYLPDLIRKFEERAQKLPPTIDP